MEKNISNLKRKNTVFSKVSCRPYQIWANVSDLYVS